MSTTVYGVVCTTRGNGENFVKKHYPLYAADPSSAFWYIVDEPNAKLFVKVNPGSVALWTMKAMNSLKGRSPVFKDIHKVLNNPRDVTEEPAESTSVPLKHVVVVCLTIDEGQDYMRDFYPEVFFGSDYEVGYVRNGQQAEAYVKANEGYRYDVIWSANAKTALDNAIVTAQKVWDVLKPYVTEEPEQPAPIKQDIDRYEPGFSRIHLVVGVSEDDAGKYIHVNLNRQSIEPGIGVFGVWKPEQVTKLLENLGDQRKKIEVHWTDLASGEPNDERSPEGILYAQMERALHDILCPNTEPVKVEKVTLVVARNDANGMDWIDRHESFENLRAPYRVHIIHSATGLSELLNDSSKVVRMVYWTEDAYELLESGLRQCLDIQNIIADVNSGRPPRDYVISHVSERPKTDVSPVTIVICENELEGEVWVGKNYDELLNLQSPNKVVFVTGPDSLREAFEEYGQRAQLCFYTSRAHAAAISSSKVRKAFRDVVKDANKRRAERGWSNQVSLLHRETSNGFDSSKPVVIVGTSKYDAERWAQQWLRENLTHHETELVWSVYQAHKVIDKYGDIQGIVHSRDAQYILRCKNQHSRDIADILNKGVAWKLKNN